MFRKILSIILTALILCSTAAITFAAEKEPSTDSCIPEFPRIEGSYATAKPGEEVSVDVRIEDNPGINTFSFEFDYDKSCLELLSVTPSEQLGGQFVYAKKAVWLGSADITFDGVLLTLRFRVRGSARAGTTTVYIRFNGGDVANYNEEDVDLYPGECRIKIEDPNAGGDDDPIDYKGDGTITVSDATAKPGDEISVDVTIAGNPGINKFAFYFDYDKNRLEFTAVDWAGSELFGQFGYYDTIQKVKWNSENNVKYNGVILTFNFKVLDNAEEGDSDFTLSYDPGDITNNRGENLDFILSAGTIKIEKTDASVIDIKTGEHVIFGRYPQRLVTDKAQLKTLNSKDLSWTYYDYYRNGKREDFMKYADVSDVFEPGDKYRAVMTEEYRPFCTTDGYQINVQKINGYELNKVYWFRYEPIVWRVLDVENGLLLTESIIDSQPFHNFCYLDKDASYSAFYADKSLTHYTSNWAYSSLRGWMNEDFYNTAFGTEKSYIKNTSLTTPSGYDDNSEYDADPTTDNVFLLSVDDVLNEAYGFESEKFDGWETETGDENRIAYGTDYARCQGLLNADYDSPDETQIETAFWRLRTPAFDATYEVTGNGYVVVQLEDSPRMCNMTFEGIRPAMNVDLQSALSNGIIKITDKNGNGIKEPEKQIIPGDVSGDGKILADDARLALRCSAKLEKLSESQILAADVDEDGQVLASDARQILRYSAKLQQGFEKVS